MLWKFPIFFKSWKQKYDILRDCSSPRAFTSPNGENMLISTFSKHMCVNYSSSYKSFDFQLLKSRKAKYKILRGCPSSRAFTSQTVENLLIINPTFFVELSVNSIFSSKCFGKFQLLKSWKPKYKIFETVQAQELLSRNSFIQFSYKRLESPNL